MRAFYKKGVVTLFRGDSHLLDLQQPGLRWGIKRALLSRLFSWPTSILVVGQGNRAYYEAFGVEPGRLRNCPHTIDANRFAHPADVLERKAAGMAA